MKLYLTKLPSEVVYGIYGASGDKLADRMLYLHPDAAKSFLHMNLAHKVRVSDMFRTALGSLQNRERNGGKGLRPGWSGHNYGFSIDIDVKWMRQEHGFKTKLELDDFMSSHGWWCHNPNGMKRSWESWHYNYFGDESDKYLAFRKDSKTGTYSNCVEQKIQDHYDYSWKEMPTEKAQELLKKVSFYDGAVDGDTGPLFKEGVKSFQRAWDLKPDGVLGPMTSRTLAYMSADRVLVEFPTC